MTPTTFALTTDTRTLGATGIEVSAIGVGTWAWGDTAFWGYGKTYTRADANAAFHVRAVAGRLHARNGCACRNRQ